MGDTGEVSVYRVHEFVKIFLRVHRNKKGWKALLQIITFEPKTLKYQHKNFSKILASSSLGPGEVSQGDLKVLHLWHHSQKICIAQPKKIFPCKLQDLLESFEPLNRSLLLLAPELCSRKATCNRFCLAWNVWILPDVMELMGLVQLF